MDLSPGKTGWQRKRGNSSQQSPSSVFFVLVFLLLVPGSLAVSVTPAKQTVTDPGEEVYQYIYTVTNNDPVPRTLVLRPEPYSTYLQERITLQPSQFSLLPGASQNVQLSITPAGLGPQTHTLAIAVFDGPSAVSRFELSVPMTGTPIERYDASVSVEDITDTQPLTLDVKLKNFGNVIGYAQARLEIISSDVVVGTVEYPDLLQVLPNEPTNITLVYSDRLQPGFYVARLLATYGNTTTRTEEPFSVTIATTRQIVSQGSDLELTFASLGSPPLVVYALVDSTGNEKSSGTFFPQTGIVIPTSRLDPGEYTLSLRMGSTTRTMTIEIRDEAAKYRMLALVLVCLIAIAGIFSLRRRALLSIKLFRLTYHVWRKEREVDKLINRAHRLVDEYAAHAARRHTATGSAGEASKRS